MMPFHSSGDSAIRQNDADERRFMVSSPRSRLCNIRSVLSSGVAMSSPIAAASNNFQRMAFE